MRDRGKGVRSITVDDGLNIVRGRIGMVFARTPNIVSAVLGRVPAPSREVHSSRKGQTVINHHNLLVVARAGRMRAVEFQVNAWMVKGILAQHQLRIAHIREEDRKLPAQYVNVEVGIPGGYRGQKIPQRRRRMSPIPTGSQPRPAVQIPAHNRNRVPRLCNTLRECLVIVRSVDEKRESARLGEPAAVTARIEHL